MKGKEKLVTTLPLLFIIASFIVGIYFYPKLPDTLASHWNVRGQVNGHTSKFAGLFILPIITTAVYGLFLLIPKIDPLKENIKKFKSYYNLFMTFLVIFFFYIYLLTVIWNLGYEFDMKQFIPPAISFLFYIIGMVLEKTKRNYFFGIRTPWTLQSDVVWEKTNKLGAEIFKLSAGVILLGVLLSQFAVILIVVTIIPSMLYLVVYSYIQYQKLSKS